MKRILLGLGVAVLLAVALIVGYRSLGDGPEQAGATAGSTDGQMSTPDGRLNFAAPAGWTQRRCPSGADACTQVAPRGGAPDDAVTVVAGPRNPVEGTPVDLMLSEDPVFAGPGLERITVDGAKAVRIDYAEMDRTNFPPGTDAIDVLVIGVVPGSTDEFMVSCGHERTSEAEMRAACDLIVQSLRISR